MNNYDKNVGLINCNYLNWLKQTTSVHVLCLVKFCKNCPYTASQNSSVWRPHKIKNYYYYYNYRSTEQERFAGVSPWPLEIGTLKNVCFQPRPRPGARARPPPSAKRCSTLRTITVTVRRSRASGAANFS